MRSNTVNLFSAAVFIPPSRPQKPNYHIIFIDLSNHDNQIPGDSDTLYENLRSDGK